MACFHYFSLDFRQSRCSLSSACPRANVLCSGFVLAVLRGCSALAGLLALPTFSFAVVLLRFQNMRMMVRRSGKTTGVRQEGCTSAVGQLGGQGDTVGTAAAPCAEPKLPQLSGTPQLPSTFFCLFPPPSPSTCWPSLTLLLKSSFLGDFCDPGLPTLGPLHWGVRGGDWSQPPALLCLLGHVTPGCSRKHNKN